MPNPTRQARLASLLHQEIAIAVQQEVTDPRCGLVAITRVEVTGDLHNVTAFFSVYGDPAQQVRAAKVLDSLRTTVQNRYAKAVHTRLLPILAFKPDVQERRRFDLDNLISKARKTDSDGGERPEPPAPDPQPDHALPT